MNPVPAEVSQVTGYKLWVEQVRVHHDRTYYFFGKIQRDIEERLYAGPEYTQPYAAFCIATQGKMPRISTHKNGVFITQRETLTQGQRPHHCMHLPPHLCEDSHALTS
jgi:hypothetical protein